ncbi:MAG TPA: tetratricopeptide repeat protein, partial [Anaeromyxobacteraceae bacterium]|nr:tetratricopeptide repeat protein [Anaeromyxobacteraceae bacterium]
AERLDTLRIADVLTRGAARAEIELADQPLVQAQVQHVIGRTIIDLSHYEEAERLLRRAAATRRAHGAPLEDLAASDYELARVLRARGDFEEALPLARRAVAARTRLYGRTDARTVEALRVLGYTLRVVGQVDESASIAREVLSRQQTTGDAAALGAAQDEWARVLLSFNRFEEAIPAASEALTTLREAYGPRHPRLEGTLTLLGMLLMTTERYAEAEPVLREAVAISAEARPGSASHGGALTDLGVVLRRQGRLAEAEAALHEALGARYPRAFDRARPLGALASVRLDRGDLAGAEAFQQEALALLRTAWPANHFTVISSAVKLAGILRRQGRFADAERLLLDLRGEVDGDHTSDGTEAARRTLDAELAALYAAWGQPEEAARYRSTASAGPADGASHAGIR